MKDREKIYQKMVIDGLELELISHMSKEKPTTLVVGNIFV